jgi:short-subunit dehydrogenase
MDRIAYASAVITGASHGLGAAVARALAGRGLRLFLVARSGDELHRRAADLRAAHGVAVETWVADLRDPEQVERAAAAAEASFHGVDVLINNAGAGSYKPLHEHAPQELCDVIALNLTAPMLLARHLAPGMVARGRGLIVNVASDLARRPLANMAPYVASKFGLLGFGQSLHRELRDAGVKVTTVLPGIIDSAFNGAREGEKDERWAMKPDAVAAQIAGLLDLSPHVTVDELTVHPARGDY